MHGSRGTGVVAFSLRKPEHVDWPSLVLVLPFIIVLLVFILLPVVLTVRYAFLSQTMIGTGGDFVGLRQFRTVVADPLFWHSLARSLRWVVGNAVIQTLVAFFFALIVNRKLSKTAGVQVLILLPWIIPAVAVAVIGTWLTNSSYGVLNYLLMSVGVIETAINAFGDPDLALSSLTVLNSWRWFPFFFVVILGALKTISNELYEQSAVDGANGLERFRSITMPLIGRILGIVGMIGTLWSFNIFDTIFLITRGGPGERTFTAPLYVYETAFRQFQMARSSAASFIVMLLLVVFAVVFYKNLVENAYSAG